MNRLQRFFGLSKQPTTHPESVRNHGSSAASGQETEGDRNAHSNIEHTARRIPMSPMDALSPVKPGIHDVDLNDEPTRKIIKRERSQEKGWVFTVISGIDKARQFLGTTAEIRIGRQPENHIQLRDPKVSRFHARILKYGSNLDIEDLGSTNGTYVNNNLIRKPHPIAAGDRISLGDTVIQVELKRL